MLEDTATYDDLHDFFTEIASTYDDIIDRADLHPLRHDVAYDWEHGAISLAWGESNDWRRMVDAFYLPEDPDSIMLDCRAYHQDTPTTYSHGDVPIGLVARDNHPIQLNAAFGISDDLTEADLDQTGQGYVGWER